ncbi:hypothetical protein [uncultured Bacteroides sp.]|uniref:hypothetical protein n=1 Tax=uncultured Bacteroides sp. TaxID=162156 RepID=UPI0026774021|nr:hypothetical protein [uncultured Bacteroides sp.]
MAELVDIKDISGKLRFSTPILEGSKRRFLLMKEDYITLKFSLAEPVYFRLGDYVDNEFGIFELVDLYKPTYNTNNGAYDYELRLDAYYWKWKNKKFFYTPESTGREAGWNLTATLDVHLNVFLDNLKSLNYKFREEDFTYEIDETVANTSKLVSYDNVNLIDALTQMAETWECEWWITDHVIHFGRCEYGDPVDFKAGSLTDTENVNVNSMQRSDSQTTYATRVYAFGSTRNIPASYLKSLIFDVKKVKGRDISDTARVLKNEYFPISTREDGGIYPQLPDGMYSFNANESIALISIRKEVEGPLPGGNYQIKINSFSYRFLPGDRTDGITDFVKLAIWLTYNVDGVTNRVDILSEEKSISQSPAGTALYLDIPNKTVNFTLPDNVSDIVIISEASTKRVRNTDSYNIGMYANDYSPAKAYSNQIIVTFISGSNEGKTYQAVYNPTFIAESESAVIRLPEGVTASLGDRYTIDNIIKGKVPDNYFSKDDKELTLNGVVQKRLTLPDGIPYVDAYRYSPTGERIDIGDERYNDPDNVEMPQEEAVEGIVIFEDEYPRYTGSVSSVTHETREEEDEDGNKTGDTYPIYTFKDTGLKNFTEDFRLDGQELRLIFQTGKLAGLDFEILLKESDDSGTTFEIVRNEDYGRYLPDDTLFPQANHIEDGEEVPADTYLLYGFDTAFISEQMLPDARQELYETTQKYVKKSMIDPSTYDCEMDSEFIYNDGEIITYEVGDRVNLINKAYFPEGRQSRIIGFEWQLDIPYDHPVYTVGETAAYSRIGEIEEKLDSLTYKGQTYSGSTVGGGGSSIYVIGVNDKTLPSDRNVFSSKKSLATFLNKTQEETMDFLIRLLGGVITDNIQSQNFISGALGTGFLVKRDPKTGRSYAEFDEIYVRLKAVFDSLTVKELQSVGGSILLTLASIECTKVERISRAAVYDSSGARLYDSTGAALYSPIETGGIYRCYFTVDDGEKAIINQFVAGDMAQCRQFNIKSGIYENVSNRYYWRYVLAVGENYIDLSVDDCEDGSDIPQAGDKIIQLGNRTDPARQNAILLSAYGLTAPTIQMLQGIDSYTLDGRAVKEEGFDQETQQFYSKNYGRSYVGDRERKEYIEYVPGSGLEAHCAVVGISDDGQSVYELLPDGTSFFGKTDPDTGKKTGVVQGVDCLVGGVKRTGIFALVDDEVVFELDPVSKQYKFTGEIYSDKGKLGGFNVGSFSLENKDGQDALIRIINDSLKTVAALGNTIPGISGFGCGSYFEASNTGRLADNRAVIIRASGSTDEFWGGGKRNLCIDAFGGCDWRMAHDDYWRMPGVLFGTRITVTSSGTPSIGISWGNGIDLFAKKVDVDKTSKIFTFTHNLGHTRYFTFITPSGQRAAGDNDPCTPSVDNIADNSFNISFWGNGNYERVYPLYFDMIIVGVPTSTSN